MTTTSGPLDLAQHWLSIDRPDRALEELDRITGEEALSLEVLSTRGIALHLLDRDVEAVLVLRSALGNHGPVPFLMAVLSDALGALDRWHEAEQVCLDGLATDPTDVSLLCAYARVCASVGQLSKADELATRASTHDPHSTDLARTKVLLALVRGDEDEAERLSRALLAQNPDDPAAWMLRGTQAAYRGDTATAYDSYRRAAAADPGNAQVVQAARELKVARHPLMRPLWPLNKFGPFKTWLAVVALMWLLRMAGLAPLALAVAIAWLLYCVYSWVAPPVVRRLMKRNG